MVWAHIFTTLIYPVKSMYKILHNLWALLSSSQHMKLVRISYSQDDTCIIVPLPGLHHRLMLITGFVLSYVETEECIVYIKVYSIYTQGTAFNFTHFESRITHFIVHSNKYNWTQSSKSLSWIHKKKKPHVFNTMSWRCPPWQSRHCCHLPSTLAMTWRSVSCVTFAISWQIAY